MIKKKLAGCLFLLIFLLGCKKPTETVTFQNNEHQAVLNSLLDSLSFEILHPDVLFADSLLHFGSADSAFMIYDSLIGEGIGDPYLEVYVKLQNDKNGLRKMSTVSADSLLKERSSELDLLGQKPFCLQMQLANLGSHLNYRINGFEYSFAHQNLLTKLNHEGMSLASKEKLYELLNISGQTSLYKNFDPYRAKDFFGEQEAMLHQGIIETDLKLGLLYYYFATVYRQLNDFELALEYAEKSRLAFKQTANYNLLAYAISEKLNNLGLLKKIDNGQTLLQELLLLVKEKNIPQANGFLFLRNYAGALVLSESFTEFERLIPTLEQEINVADTIQLADLLEQKSWLAEAKGDFPQAINYYTAAIHLYQDYSENDNQRLASCYSNLGSLFADLGQMDSAVIYKHKGIQIASNQIYDIKSFPDVEIFHGLDEEISKIDDFALALQNSDFPTGTYAENILLANKYYDYLIGLFDQYIEGKEDQALLRDLNEFHNLFGAAIRCKFFSKGGFIANQDVVFDLMEKSKALLLQNSIYARALADQLGIPDSTFQHLLNLEEEIADIQTSQLEEDPTGSKRSYSLLVIEKKNLLNQIRKTFPEFFNVIRTSYELTLPDVQHKLEPKETLLQYHWTKEGLFAIAISKLDIKFKYIENVDELSNRITILLEEIQSPPGADFKQSTQTFLKHSSWLDSVLMFNLVDKENTKDLIIVPDGLLGRLPFELLTNDVPADNNSFYDIDYLIKNMGINYGFSSSLFFQQKELKRQKKKPKIKLFAYSDQKENVLKPSNKNWNELPASGREVDKVEKIFSSFNVEKWKGKNCTKEHFYQAALEADVLHLALHGQSDPENRWGNKLIFKGDSTLKLEDKLIYGYELRGMKLKTSFVFLSACETGTGIEESGEGIYSLGRSFAGAGVPSIAMGMWNLNDEISEEIVVDFYSKLKKGTTPSKALQLAKQNYLEGAHDRLAHPYYWAPLVVIGGGHSPFK